MLGYDSDDDFGLDPVLYASCFDSSMNFNNKNTMVVTSTSGLAYPLGTH